MPKANQGLARGLARQSLKEERKAVTDYSNRADQAKDTKLKGIFQHAIPEEREHARLFGKYLRRGH